MAEVFEITGMHCEGCASRVQRAATAIAPGATVTLDPPRLTLPTGSTLDAAAINTALAAIGDYRAKEPAAG
ncbi:MAG: heavy metal transporter [Chelatococcus sp.]|nr:MAG: heavy metal transporter [Chelatococcus sp.]